jgi:hypothetical protein
MQNRTKDPRIPRCTGTSACTLLVLVLCLLLAAPAQATVIMENLNFLGPLTLTVSTNADAGAVGDISAAATLSSGSPISFNGGHLNWLNVVRNGSADFRPGDPRDRTRQVNFPWIDPLSGGNIGFRFDLADDTLPFYWGEQAPTATEVPDHTVGRTLNFFDHPSDPGVPNGFADFETYLLFIKGPVGQTANKTFDVLGGFDWTFTENATGTGELAISNLGFAVITQALLSQLDGDLQRPYNFPGWHAVPEPESLWLLFVGLVFVMTRSRLARGIATTRCDKR